MDEPSQTPIDINTAEEKELTALPGVGQATARKIIAARPFKSLDGLLAIQGINPVLAERIRPNFQDIPAVKGDESGGDAPAGATPSADEDTLIEKARDFLTGQPEKLKDFLDDQPENLEKLKSFLSEQPDKLKDFLDDQPENLQKLKGFLSEQPEKLKDFLDDQPENLKKTGEFIAAQPEKFQEFIAAQPEKFEKVKASTGLTNANLVTLLVACLATMLLTILLTIALMGAVNGGLRYASQAEFAALNRQVAAAASQLEMLEKDTDSIRARLDALESMSGRMKLIEEENAAIREQLDENNRQVEGMRSAVEEAQSEIERLTTSTSFFDRVISGLRDLLNETTRP